MTQAQPVKVYGAEAQDRTGQVWEHVWCMGLTTGASVEAVKIMADAAQKIAYQVYEIPHANQ